jgi:hypothetical protein
MAYTNIDDPSAYFQTKIWTGTGAAGNTITLDGNSDMQPDFMWHKEPTDANGWHQIDSSRGTTYILASQSTTAEYDVLNTYISSFNSNGFTAGYGDSSINSNGVSQCSWMWHCNGGSTSSNTDGSITSTVQANQDAGFSIVTYTGTGSAGTIGHGLGVAPKVVLVKARSRITSWIMFHKDGSTSDDDYYILQGTFVKGTQAGIWNNQYPSSTVFGASTDLWLNNNADTYVAYCFAEKQGYSKFGKYVGNGNANGAFIYTGFKPAFVIVKRSDSANNWIITDNARGINGANPRLYADLTDAEGSAADYIDHLSNGFKIRTSAGSMNTSGGTYIYMAFAEHPFVTSTGIPTTAR